MNYDPIVTNKYICSIAPCSDWPLLILLLRSPYFVYVLVRMSYCFVFLLFTFLPSFHIEFLFKVRNTHHKTVSFNEHPVISIELVPHTHTHTLMNTWALTLLLHTWTILLQIKFYIFSRKSIPQSYYMNEWVGYYTHRTAPHRTAQTLLYMSPILNDIVRKSHTWRKIE